jgi:hypothetical protein
MTEKSIQDESRKDQLYNLESVYYKRATSHLRSARYDMLLIFIVLIPFILIFAGADRLASFILMASIPPSLPQEGEGPQLLPPGQRRQSFPRIPNNLYTQDEGGEEEVAKKEEDKSKLQRENAELSQLVLNQNRKIEEFRRLKN